MLYNSDWEHITKRFQVSFFFLIKSHKQEEQIGTLRSETRQNSSSVTWPSLKAFETGRVTLSCFDVATVNKCFLVLNR